MIHSQKNVFPLRDNGFTEKEFEIIYSKYYERVYSFIANRVKEKELVSELSFDAFLKLWHYLKKGNYPDNIEAYLIKISKNIIYDYYQSVSKTKGKQVFLDVIPEVKNNAQNPEQFLLNKELKAELEKSIKKLSPQSEQIFRMIRIDGLKYSEVAERLNISVNSVDTQLSRAIKKLRKSLKDYREEKHLIVKNIAKSLSLLLPIEIIFKIFF